MPENLDLASVVIGAAAGLALASLFAWLVLRERMARVRAEHHALAGRAERAESQAAAHEETVREREALLRELGAARGRIAELGARLEGATAQAQERLGLLQNARESLKETFQALAGEILEDKSRRFTQQNATQLGSLLEPLREQLKEFRQNVADTYQKDTSERAVLRHEIETLRSLNERIGKEALDLTRALKGESRTQGAWGELVLERVLEASGLMRGREFDVQGVLAGEDGTRPRPDVIVHLPDGKDVVIDSKVALTAYERWCSAADEVERGPHLALHLQSLRRHATQLGERNYAGIDGLRTLDFVLMFVPVEAALVDAVRHDDTLYTYALSRNVAIVGPSTLLATLRTVSHLWRMEARNANAVEIAQKAGKLYDKFVGLVGDLDRIGTSIAQAQKSWDSARNKLTEGRGNLVRRVEELRQLGADTSKALPEAIRERALEAEAGAALPRPDDDAGSP